MKKMTKAMLMTALILGSVSMGTAVEANELNTFTMDEYVVTASRYAKADLDIAADTQVVTSEDLANIGATNVIQALQTVNGLVYQAKGPGGAGLGAMTSKVSMRGFETGTLVLVNGTPINYRGLYNLENIPVDNIERIEIVKGGGAVLYGSEATGGVINIITKRENNNSLRVGAGNNGRENHSFSTQAGKLGFTYTYDKWGDIGRVSDLRSKFDMEKNNKSQYFNGSERNNFDVKYNFDENIDLIYRHGEANSYYTYLLTEGYGKKEGKPDYNRKFNKDEDFLQLNFKDDDGLKGNVYYNRNDHCYTGTRFGYESDGTQKSATPTLSKEENLTYGYDVQKLWQENKNNYLIGTSYQREEFQEYDEGAWSTRRSRNNFSVYGSWETGVGTNDIFTVSARETWTTGAAENKNYNNFSAQAQYLHKIDEQQSAYVSVGQSFEMPSFSDMYSSSENGGRIRGNATLKPSKGMHYETGYKHETDTHKYKVALFATKIKDNISFSKSSELIPDTNDSYYYDAVNEDFKNAGIELSAVIDAQNGWSYNYGITYSDPKSKSTSTKSNIKKGWLDTFGKLQLTGGVTYHQEKWTANLTANYLAERVLQTNTAGVVDEKPYLLTTFNLRYDADKNNEITLSIDNVLDRKDNVNHSSSTYYSTPFTYLLSYTHKF